jgi:hypothetical protein
MNRTIALLAVVGSILSAYKGKERTRTLEMLSSRINKAIRAHLRGNIELANIIQATDDVFKEASEKFENVTIEGAFFVSVFQSMDSKNFKKLGITDKLVDAMMAHYYHHNPKIKENGLELDQNTREVCIWIYNKISDICELPHYQPKRRFARC